MKSNLLPVLTLMLTLLGFVATVQPAQAKAAVDVKIRLVAAPDFGPAKGAAKIRDRRGEREFQVEVEVSRRFAGSIFVVRVDDEIVGEMTIDAFGKGRLYLNSQAGDTMPSIAAGTVVQVLAENDVLVVAGQF